MIAWVLAIEVLSLPQSFLAPWAALLTVHATVYRSIARGLQQVAAAVAGVLLAFAAGAVLGVSAASLALMLLVAMAVGALRPMRAESTTAAATALVVLLTGYSDDGSMLLARLADTFVGIAAGLAVNLAVWPPLRDRAAARRIDRLDDGVGALLADMAGDLRDRSGDPRPGGLGRTDAPSRPRDRRGLGRRPAGARERAPEPAQPGDPARARHVRPRRGARRSRAGGRRGPQHGPDDGPGRRRRRVGRRLPRRLDRDAPPGRGRAVGEADPDGVRDVRDDLESIAAPGTAPRGPPAAPC